MRSLRMLLTILKLTGAFPYKIYPGETKVQPIWLVWSAIVCVILLACGSYLLMWAPSLSGTSSANDTTSIIWFYIYLLCFLITSFYAFFESSRLARVLRMVEELNSLKWGKENDRKDLAISALVSVLYVCLFMMTYVYLQIPEKAKTEAEVMLYVACYVTLWCLGGGIFVSPIGFFLILTWKIKVLNRCILTENLNLRSDVNQRRSVGWANHVVPWSTPIHESHPKQETQDKHEPPRKQLILTPRNFVVVERQLVHLERTVDEMMRYVAPVIIQMSLGATSGSTFLLYSLIDRLLSTSTLDWMTLVSAVAMAASYLVICVGPDLVNSQVTCAYTTVLQIEIYNHDTVNIYLYVPECMLNRFGITDLSLF